MFLILLIMMSAQATQQPKPTSPLDACHQLIASGVNADVKTASFKDMSDVRDLLVKCVGNYGEQLSKMDLMGAFYILQTMDNEISQRMKKEVQATMTALEEAKKSCMSH